MRCLVVGGSGQDGVLLSAQLLAEGHDVVSVSRSRSPLDAVDHRTIDLSDTLAVAGLVSDVKPDHVYYLAAWHRSSEDEAPDRQVDLASSLRVNALALVGVLQALQRHAPAARTVYASSCRVFGRGDGSLLDESSPRHPLCMYGVSKAAGMSVADHFRNECGMRISSAILFNHESELRRPNFLSKKLALAALAARKDPRSRVMVANVDDKADWGSARDYVAAMRAIAMTDECGDFVVATGQLRTVGEFAEACFSAVGIDWTRHVVCAPEGTRSGWLLAGNSGKLARQTGWEPTCTFQEMVQDLVRRSQDHERQRSADFHSYL